MCLIKFLLNSNRLLCLVLSVFCVFNTYARSVEEMEGRFDELSNRQWVGGTGSQRAAATTMDTAEMAHLGVALLGAKHETAADSGDVTEASCWFGWVPPKCVCAEPLHPPLCRNPNQTRDDCIGTLNSCFGACADREDVLLPPNSRADRSCFSNTFYIAYGLGCMPVQIVWRILSWPFQGSWNCFEDVCAELNASTIMLCRKEPRFGLEVTGLCCSSSYNIESKRATYLGTFYCPPCGGHKVREDRSASKIRESSPPQQEAME